MKKERNKGQSKSFDGVAHNSRKKRLSRLFSLSIFVNLLSRFTDLVYDALINSFIGHIFTAYSSEQLSFERGAVKSYFDGGLISTARTRKIKQNVERVFETSFVINKLKSAGSLKSVIKAHPGMQIYLAELTITIMGTIDVIEDSNHTKMKNGNDSSVVSMFEINGGKVLLTGDCEPQEGKIIRDIYGGIGNKNSPLKADFIQVAHHGYGNTNTDYIGCDQNALNVMASGGGTAAGSSPIYALVPVGLENGKDPAGYYDAVQGMHAMRIFSEDHRLVAYNKNLTIKFNTNGTHTIEKTKKGNFWIGTWSTY